jgi:hypothetical protein
LEIRRQILGHRVRDHLRLLPERKSHCPPAEVVARVPREYPTAQATRTASITIPMMSCVIS